MAFVLDDRVGAVVWMLGAAASFFAARLRKKRRRRQRRRSVIQRAGHGNADARVGSALNFLGKTGALVANEKGHCWHQSISKAQAAGCSPSRGS